MALKSVLTNDDKGKFSGELSVTVHSARPRKIPGWIVVIPEIFAVNKSY